MHHASDVIRLRRSGKQMTGNKEAQGTDTKGEEETRRRKGGRGASGDRNSCSRYLSVTSVQWTLDTKDD